MRLPFTGIVVVLAGALAAPHIVLAAPGGPPPPPPTPTKCGPCGGPPLPPTLLPTAPIAAMAQTYRMEVKPAKVHRGKSLRISVKAPPDDSWVASIAYLHQKYVVCARYTHGSSSTVKACKIAKSAPLGKASLRVRFSEYHADAHITYPTPLTGLITVVK